MPNPTPGGKLLPIEMDMLARATGQQPFDGGKVWFGPGQPLPPQAPEQVKGRRMDYPFAANTTPRPRGEQGENAIDFPTLRRISDPTQGGLDLLRLAIETRKDQMAAQKWTIKGRDGKDGGDKAKRIFELLQEPDGVNDFQAWQRLLMDDHLVIDQPAIYLRPTTKGYRLPEVMDGGTLKRIVSESGRTPLPPLPAFAQQIKGLAAVEYTLDEIIVRPYNPRSHRIYSMGPVEQVVNIVNLSLRRMLHQTEFYTAGSIPDGLLVGPEGLNPDQLQDFQDDFDAVLAGNTAGRRLARWVPFGTHFLQTKEPDLTGAVDEWLARIICWCFSLSPQALVKEQNRATAETSKETGLQEGLEPRKLWFKALMDAVIRRAYDAQDLEFAWQDEEITDPLVKMQVWTGYKNAGVVDADEVRDKALGMEPQTEEQKAAAAPPPSPFASLVAPGKEPGKPGAKPGTTQGEAEGSASQLPPVKSPAAKPGGDAPAKIQKKKRGRPTRKKLRPIARERAAVKVAERKIRSIMVAALGKARSNAVKAALKITGLVTKADGDFSNLWSDKDREKIRQELEEALAELARDGAEEAVQQIAHAISADAEEIQALLEQANERAIAWASERAADLVGMTRDPDTGDWIENPNPRWSIDQTTRDGLQGLVEEAERDGWTNQELSAAVEDFAGFDEARSDMIARTESAFADIAGNLEGWKATGQVELKQWIIGQDEVCEDCLALEGKTVRLDEDFPGGDPPLHPNCFLPGTVVSAAGVTRQMERRFEGEIVRLFIEGQDPLAVTPNHPILTRRGWIPAGELQEGDDLFRVSDPGALVRACDPEDHHMETRIEEVANALLVAGGVSAVSVPVTAEHFHGDGTPGENVRIVGANGSLDLALHPGGMEQTVEPSLMLTDTDLESLARGGYAGTMFAALGLPPDGIMGLGDSGKPGLGADPGSLDDVGLGATPNGQPNPAPSLAECAAMATQRIRNIHAAFASLVSPVKLEKLVRGERWVGHVYNLETKGGWYVAGSILTHNCRCDLLPVLAAAEDAED